MTKYLILFIYLFLSIAASVAGSAQAQTRDTTTIYAAASLKDALDAIVKPRARVKVVYAASSTLARQIEQGAPADIFISADEAWMDYLAQRALLGPTSRVNLLTSRLVLIAPAGSKLNLTIAPNFPLARALGNQRLALADPASVPAGKYAKAALESLGVWNPVSRQLAPAENVRAALLLVARGETPLGIVYASDVVAEPRVRVIGEFPAHTHAPIVYPAAVLAGAKSAEAQVWLDYLRADTARATWRKFGFGMAP